MPYFCTCSKVTLVLYKNKLLPADQVYTTLRKNTAWNWNVFSVKCLWVEYIHSQCENAGWGKLEAKQSTPSKSLSHLEFAIISRFYSFLSLRDGRQQPFWSCKYVQAHVSDQHIMLCVYSVWLKENGSWNSCSKNVNAHKGI